MPTSAIVTGGAGFLGSHLCESLLEAGYEVYCVDNFGSGTKRNIKQLNKYDRFTVVKTDIREETAFPPVDEIYHFASRASPADFTKFPVRIALTNTEGTRHLLDHAVKHDAAMLYASTSEVYGDPEVHPQPESYNGNVNIRGVRGCYDESKRFGETLTVAYHDRYDVDVRTVRIFNTYGPRMRPNDGRVVPTFVTQAINGENLTIYGNGSQTRTFCYVDDMVQGLYEIMNTDELAGDVVNVGGQNEITIKTLAETILEIYDTDSELVYEQLPEDDPTQRKPDITKARELLGWEPTTDLETGLESTIEYFETIEETTRSKRA